MMLASRSSFFRRGVTFGCGMVEETWLSMFSKIILRTWLVFFGCPLRFVSPSTSGESVRPPL